MSLISKLLGVSKEKEEKASNVHWIPLTSFSELDEIEEISKKETVVIFKHSTRCGISRMVIKQFENKFDENLKGVKVYYLDLLNYREISDEVGYRFQVLHQSPQVLVIKDRVVVAHDSHYNILSVDLKALL
ncbi:MAG: bacillithiol system redox-active protein YtxJ [Flavobacteriaceae bacterium]|nr:bacillithiol system redox-active protein YtxJ [Flavobacteriaceae bacterium]